MIPGEMILERDGFWVYQEDISDGHGDLLIAEDDFAHPIVCWIPPDLIIELAEILKKHLPKQLSIQEALETECA